MEYIYDKLLVVDGIESVERTKNTVKLFINGSKTDYYRQIFESHIVIKYLYLDYEPIIPLIFYHCFINTVSVGRVKDKYGIFVSISYEQVTPERSLKIRKIKSKMI